MTHLSPTALEAAAKAAQAKRTELQHAPLARIYSDLCAAAITAYLAQREKEGWVVVPVEPSCDQLVAGMEAWGRLDDAEEEVAAIYTEMIAQNGGEPCK